MVEEVCGTVGCWYIVDSCCCCGVVGDGDVVNVGEGVSVDEVVVVAWFVPAEGGLEEVVLVPVGGEGEGEGAVVGTEDIEAVSLESCPDKSSGFVPNVSNGVWYG
jgi:hypothetical protein